MAFLWADLANSVYTRRPSLDVFQNDPFKIQSYNFHYAERPAYPMQHYQRPSPIPSEPTPFKTYFYNVKFNRNAESKLAAATPPAGSFIETRRRQFLQDFNRVAPPVTREIFPGPKTQERHRHPVASIPPVAANPHPLLRICCNREDYQAMRRGQSATTIRQSASASVTNLKAPAKQPSQSSVKLSPKRTASSCSGCTININITSIDSEVDVSKALKIKIEADNTDKCQVTMPRRCCSTKSFVIDKRLSKFSVLDSQKDVLLAKRLQLQSERERLEKLRQQELHKEQELARQREQERECLRQAERQRDHERLLQLEAEREFHRLRELERETQRRRELELAERRRKEAQAQRQPMRAMSMTERITKPVVMTSHLSTPASAERLPGMAPCYVRPSSEANRAERLEKSTGNLSRLQKICSRCPHSATPATTQAKAAPRTVERRSSGGVQFNAIVHGGSSNTSLHNERKLLNLHVNGKPITSSVPIHTRINNLPIRITTSQPQDKNLRFSVNRVTAGQSQSNPNRSRTAAVEELPASPCNVSINVYADNPRTMRL
ncbi:LOW QUALITY PROTEIN: putative uncharacterized protein DDB_G0271982 [Drosophila nasuta]|uniref:LOW QUALITY PROTEIN: putative uncharacterized protein DDB_G0271982 n=1 Tax=Drosophila nasuta TaxID=42062 RepID=UPI00295F489F|nr:LOW QUALITY PROTEIN: putative uncharacterized protein DDB_G0271982 [Drosophila nasuta]